jgi:lipopolysaccharide cholinephosphotransferase
LFSTEFSARFPEIHNGIFLDVLAQDYTSNNKFISKLHMHASASSRWLVLNKWRGTPVDANSKVSSFIANVLKKIFPLCVLEAVQNKLLALYKNKKNAKYLYDSMGRNVTRGAFPVEWLNEAVYVDFENTKLPVPKEYDKYLTYLYGDYMDMIPVSQRHVSHDIVQMDLGEYTNYSCKSK